MSPSGFASQDTQCICVPYGDHLLRREPRADESRSRDSWGGCANAAAGQPRSRSRSLEARHLGLHLVRLRRERIRQDRRGHIAARGVGGARPWTRRGARGGIRRCDRQRRMASTRRRSALQAPRCRRSRSWTSAGAPLSPASCTPAMAVERNLARRFRLATWPRKITFDPPTSFSRTTEKPWRALASFVNSSVRSPVVSALSEWKEKWSRRESNPRPLECHSSALPTELRPHRVGLRRRSPFLQKSCWLYKASSGLTSIRGAGTPTAITDPMDRKRRSDAAARRRDRLPGRAARTTA